LQLSARRLSLLTQLKQTHKDGNKQYKNGQAVPRYEDCRCLSAGCAVILTTVEIDAAFHENSTKSKM
jgi:hypothetical protein